MGEFGEDFVGDVVVLADGGGTSEVVVSRGENTVCDVFESEGRLNLTTIGKSGDAPSSLPPGGEAKKWGLG